MQHGVEFIERLCSINTGVLRARGVSTHILSILPFFQRFDHGAQLADLLRDGDIVLVGICGGQ